MSGEEDRILKQIKPCIEKMVMDITRQQPEDAVNKFIYNKINILGKIHDRMAPEFRRIHIHWINHRRKEGIRISSFTSKKIS